MRAALLTGHGGPEVLDVRDDVATPTPGPGQARIRVTAAGVNNTDIWSREGAYGSASDPEAVAGWQGEPLTFPLIQGADAVGVVEVVGRGEDERWVGRRVLVDPAFYDGESDTATPVGLLGSEADGAFAEHLVADVAALHDVSSSPLDDPQLACLPIAYGTAMGMVRTGRVADGDVVVVTGASGGVGLANVQLARARGATVLAVTTATKATQVAAAGAHHVLDRTRALPPQVERAAPDGVDVVLDVVGGDGFGAWPALLARYGRVVVAGAVAGPTVTLDLRRLYLHQRAVLGSTMHTRADLRELVSLARRGDVAPVVSATYPLEQIVEAQARLRDPETVGKVVVLP